MAHIGSRQCPGTRARARRLRYGGTELVVYQATPTSGKSLAGAVVGGVLGLPGLIVGAGLLVPVLRRPRARPTGYPGPQPGRTPR